MIEIHYLSRLVSLVIVRWFIRDRGRSSSHPPVVDGSRRVLLDVADQLSLENYLHV